MQNKHCVPCEEGALPLKIDEINKHLKELRCRWEKIIAPPEGHIKKIRSQFSFSDFKTAIAYVNRIAAIAEAEGHHPDIHIFYNKVIIELWTRAISGLSENDFIIAMKIENCIDQRSMELSKNKIIYEE